MKRWGRESIEGRERERRKGWDMGMRGREKNVNVV